MIDTIYSNLLLFAILYAVVLALVLILKNKTLTLPKFWLGIVLLAFASIIFDIWTQKVDLDIQISALTYTYYNLVSIIPLGIWLYVKGLTQDNILPFTRLEKLAWGLVSIEVIMKITSIISKGEIWFSYLIYDYLGLLTTAVFLPKCIIALNQYREQIDNNYANSARFNYQWLRQLLILFCVLVIVWLFAIVGSTWFAMSSILYAGVWGLIASGIFFIGIKGYLHPHIFHDFELVETYRATKPTTIEQKTTTSISTPKFELKAEAGTLTITQKNENKDHTQLERILGAMQEQKLYRSPKLSIKNLAEQLHQSPKAISKIINQQLDMTFSDFVNLYRVEEVKHRIRNRESKELTMLALAFDAGFNSKSSFYYIFKKFTNMSPSDYENSLSF